MAWANELVVVGVDRHWDLSQTSGNFLPVVGTDEFTVNSGTLTRNPTNGPFSDATMTINGAGNTTPAAELNTNAWTWAIWVKPSGTGYRGIVGGGSSYRTWYLLDRRLEPYGFAWSSSVGPTLTEDEWHLIVVGGDGTSVTYWLNGVVEHTWTGATVAVDAATANWGANNIGSETFNAPMAHPATWDHKLTNQQVADLWNASIPEVVVTGITAVAANTTSYVENDSSTTAQLIVPTNMQANDVLVVAIMHRSATLTEPAGFTRAGWEVSPTTFGYDQYTEIWTADEASLTPSAAYIFTQSVTNRFVMQQFIARPSPGHEISVDSTSSAGVLVTEVSGNPYNHPANEPVGVADGLAILAGSCAYAGNFTVSTGWTQHTAVSITDNRLMVASRELTVGGTLPDTFFQHAAATHQGPGVYVILSEAQTINFAARTDGRDALTTSASVPISGSLAVSDGLDAGGWAAPRITLVAPGGTPYNVTSNASTTVPTQPNLQFGDVLFAVVMARPGTTTTAPAGWTLVTFEVTPVVGSRISIWAIAETPGLTVKASTHTFARTAGTGQIAVYWSILRPTAGHTIALPVTKFAASTDNGPTTHVIPPVSGASGSFALAAGATGIQSGTSDNNFVAPWITLYNRTLFGNELAVGYQEAGAWDGHVGVGTWQDNTDTATVVALFEIVPDDYMWATDGRDTVTTSATSALTGALAVTDGRDGVAATGIAQFDGPVIAGFEYVSAYTFFDGVTVTKPSGVNVNDLLVILVASDVGDAPTWVAPAGWTLGVQSGDGASDIQVVMFWRIADGTEAATEYVEFTFPNQTSVFTGWYLRVTNADLLNPFGPVTSSVATSFGTTYTQSTVTTTVDNSLVVSFVGFDGADGAPHGQTNPGWPPSWPTNQAFGNPPETNLNGLWSGWLTKNMGIAGNAGDVTYTSAISDGWAHVAFAINAASTFLFRTDGRDTLTATTGVVPVTGSAALTDGVDVPTVAIQTDAFPSSMTLVTVSSLNPGEVGVTVGDDATADHTAISGTVVVTGADPILTEDYAYRGLYTISPTIAVPGDIADGNGWVILASLGDFQLRLRRDAGTTYRIRADFVTATAAPTSVTGQINLANDTTHTIGLGVVRYYATGAMTLWRSDDRWATWSPIPLSTNTLVSGLLPDADGESIRLLGGDLRDGPWIAIFRAQWGGT